MNTLKGLLSLGVLVCLLNACGAGEDLHSVGMNAKILTLNQEANFVTPSGSIATHAAADLIGKPYLIATYPAGFSPGNDPALDSVWGTIPENLEIGFSTGSHYANGAYDIVLVVYVVTEITESMKLKAEDAPTPVEGDLATFTIDMSPVRDGDPTIMPGVLRINVDGADTVLEIENRTPADPDDNESFLSALTNTIMYVP